jgi:hypothetical protein
MIYASFAREIVEEPTFLRETDRRIVNKNNVKLRKNLYMSKKSSTFAG